MTASSIALLISATAGLWFGLWICWRIIKWICQGWVKLDEQSDEQGWKYKRPILKEVEKVIRQDWTCSACGLTQTTICSELDGQPAPPDGWDAQYYINPVTKEWEWLCQCPEHGRGLVWNN